MPRSIDFHGGYWLTKRFHKGLKQLRDNMTVSWSDTKDTRPRVRPPTRDAPNARFRLQSEPKTSSLIDVLAANKFCFFFQAVEFTGSNFKVLRTAATSGLSVQALMHALNPKMKSLEFHMLFTLDEDTMDIGALKLCTLTGYLPAIHLQCHHQESSGCQRPQSSLLNRGPQRSRRVRETGAGWIEEGG